MNSWRAVPDHFPFEFDFLFRVAGKVNGDVIVAQKHERLGLEPDIDVFQHFQMGELVENVAESDPPGP